MLNSLSRFGSQAKTFFSNLNHLWRASASVNGVPSLNRYRQTPLTGSEQWESHAARLARYRVYEGYYSNQVYYDHALMTQLQVNRPKLYKWIRGVVNPVQRFVELRQSKIYGGMLDMETASDGAMPIAGADERLRESIIQLWQWSNMQQRKSIFVKNGAIYGDTAWKVVDAPAYGMVWLEPLLPHYLLDYTADSAGELTMVDIAYDRSDPVDGKTYTYREVFTLDKIYTFRDGEPYAFYEDIFGEPVSEWDNEYGFIPVALAQDVTTGYKYGENGFAHVLTKIDEVNDQASLLNDQIRKVINPRWAVFGARIPAEGLASSSNRDEVDLLEFPLGGSLSPFTNALDITSTRLNIDALITELERDMPELALHRLREGGNLTAPGVQAAYSDASGRIEEAQGNYDAATVKAMQMAVAIGGYRGYRGFQGYSLDQMWNGDLAFSIKSRPIVSDRLSRTERLTALQSIGNTELLLKELEYDDETIERVLNREDENTRAAIRGLAGAAFGEQDDEESEDDADAETETEEADAPPFANA